MFNRILTVCLGNICRSPTAAYLFRHHLTARDIRVESAGLTALDAWPMDEQAAALLRENGMDAQAHRSRQLTRELMRECDLILGMEKRHLAAMAQLAPEASGKMFLLDKWIASRDIPDPYRQPRRVFDEVYQMIEQGVQSWIPYL